jgi:hypothetical protein
VSPRLLAILMIRSDTCFFGLDQNVLVGALDSRRGCCAQGKSRNAKELLRLVFSYVMHYGFALYSSMFVPKLFPSFPTAPLQ